MDTSILRQLTVFLMTADPNYLQRQLSFIGDWGSHILILDGSEKPQQNLDTKSRNAPRITYFHDRSIYRRFRFAAEQEPTRFAMVVSDDDVFLKSGVISALHTLVENPELSCVFGPALGIGQDPYQPHFVGLYNITEDKNSDLSGRLGWTDLGKTPEERVIGHALPYKSKFFYSVHSGDVLKKIFRVVGQFPESPPEVDHFVELTLEFLTVALAPAGTVNELFWLRSEERRNNNTPPATQVKMSAIEFIRSPGGRLMKKHLSDIMDRNLIEENARNLVLEAIYTHFPKNDQFSSLYSHHHSPFARFRRLARRGLRYLARTEKVLPTDLQLINRFLSRRFRSLYDTHRSLSSFESNGGRYCLAEVQRAVDGVQQWHLSNKT